MTLPPREALRRLRDGHRRYLAGSPRARDHGADREALTGRQQPFAVVLGCSDSRVPPEVIFDQALGDLFVVRVAGNVAGASQVASIEFAVEALGARLIVVLGHQSCGAVMAALASRDEAGSTSPSMAELLAEIRPALGGIGGDSAAEVEAAVEANVSAASQRLLERSDSLTRLKGEGRIEVVEAVYSLEDGAVSGLNAAGPGDSKLEI